ncbi:phosphatase PAP2 family protein [Aquimarina sp. ERC-38]|uniref:phosphatase PAP2 family protein n=1 Tax=Aquimarina sp. ERC-38 TaxID=2949996 RepID=UPI0022485F6A|nr:phosphatase PAP2 family protein [Aquimarina sp. ERC-38]UZO81093.1 phosphatase PAP2 family protein [Aquimarina sp. ERC-38]
MKKNIPSVFRLILVITFLYSSSYAQEVSSPYETDFWKDGAWLTAGFGLSAYGLILIQNKDDLTQQEFESLNEDDINGFDRWAAGNYSESASTISDIPFYASFATPFILLFDDKMNNHTGQISVMLLENLSTTAAMFSITAGLVNRSRPKVYSDELELSERLEGDSQRSFYSGHVAASAASTFFAAQVYSDFYPNSKAKPYIWAAAAVIPAAVGYFRIESGNHFLSDVLLGYAIGAASGIFVPRLHRKTNKNISLIPSVGRRYQAVTMAYRF